MTEVFYKQLFDNLPPIEQQSLDTPTVLKTYRQYVKKNVDSAIQEYSAFALAWASHTLLLSPPNVGILVTPSDQSEPLSPSQQLACLLVTEVLSSLDRTPPRYDKDSPFLPILVTDSLSMLQDSKDDDDLLTVERNCIYDLVEELLPTLMQPELLHGVLSAAKSNDPLPENIQKDLEITVRKWVSIYQEDSYVDPIVWANTEGERKELGRLVEQARVADLSDNDLLRPLPSVKAPFCRPLPPPLLPIYGYDEQEQPLNEEEKNDLLEYIHADLLWLTPTTLRLMLLPDEGEDAKETEEYRHILCLLQEKAFSSPLSPNDQRTLLDALGTSTKASGITSNCYASEIESNDNEDDTDTDLDDEWRLQLIQDSGLTPQNLPKLVEHNPLIAHECLLIVLSNSSEPIKNEFLSALVGMDMTLHTMEVVNRLATHNVHGGGGEPILHPEYVNLFITSCIASCENIQDRHGQNRLVRLVCVFIQSLLRNNIVHVQVRLFC